MAGGRTQKNWYLSQKVPLNKEKSLLICKNGSVISKDAPVTFEKKHILLGKKEARTTVKILKLKGRYYKEFTGETASPPLYFR